MDSKIDWLIIGGGIQGTYLSNLLVHTAGIHRDQVRVLDPYERPLSNWQRLTRNCGMQHLRSPSTHNIDLGILSLYQFARSQERHSLVDFIPPYNRPSLSLFQKHCEKVVCDRELGALRIQGRALAVKKQKACLEIETDRGNLFARHLIVAIGLNEQPFWPDWAKSLRRETPHIHHVFDQAFSRTQLAELPVTVVVGGGLTGVQTALAISKEKKTELMLLTKHPLRVDNLDFDPCWIGPKCLRGFHKTPYPDRRPLVEAARHKGTITEEVHHQLHQAVKKGRVKIRVADIVSVSQRNGRLQLHTSASLIRADQILLATGFESIRPGGPLIDQMIKEFRLKCAACGFPVIGQDLRWHEHIFLTGPLAELQLGPATRNIVGARNAGRQLLQYIL
jgi:thioredoxin reductase